MQGRPIAMSTPPTLSTPCCSTAQWQQTQGQQNDMQREASQQHVSSGSAKEEEEETSKVKERLQRSEPGSMRESHAAGGGLIGVV